MKFVAGVAAFFIVSTIGNKVINGKLIQASKDAKAKVVKDFMESVKPAVDAAEAAA